MEISTPAILFPALSLLMLAYTNKYLAIASIIRQLSKHVINNSQDSNSMKQVNSLFLRINLLKITQAFGLGSIIMCVLSIAFLFKKLYLVGEILFFLSLVLMLISLFTSFFETLISGNALKIELEKIKQYSSQRKKRKKFSLTKYLNMKPSEKRNATKANQEDTPE